MRRKEVKGSLIELAQTLVSESLGLGDEAIDATLGNGHDTLFLSGCVGETGKVYGFDIQEEALRATGQRLSRAGIEKSAYELHLRSHESMAACVPGDVGAIMFNLGYLPGGDKSRITQMETTLRALETALGLLNARGILTVMCYPGHEGGLQESEAVKTLLSGVGNPELDVQLYERVGAMTGSAFLIVVKKQPAPGGELAAID